MKKIKKLLKGIQGYIPIDLTPGQEKVDIHLLAKNTAKEISDNFVVCSLKPLLFAMVWAEPQPKNASNVVTFSDAENNAYIIASLHLSLHDQIKIDDTHYYCVYTVIDRKDYTLPSMHRYIDDKLYLLDSNRKKKDPNNFIMENKDLLALALFYIRPRPVVLTSVKNQDKENLFPMDLIGTTGTNDGPFSMALRSTSPAISIIEATHKLAIGDAPFAKKDVVYALGKHHKKPSIDWQSMDHPILETSQLSYKLPAWCAHQREMEVRQIHKIGSHHVFMCHSITDNKRLTDKQMHHTTSRYIYYRKQKGQADEY